MSKRAELLPSFWATKEHGQWREKIKASFDECLAPAANLNYTQIDYKTLIRQLYDRGVSGLRFDSYKGGQGAGLAVQAIFAEYLGGVPSVAIGTAITIHLDMVAPIVCSQGSPEQIEKFLKPAIKGDILFSHAVSEREVGSDVSDIQTFAVKDGTGWRINGKKSMVLLAPIADMHFIVARLPEYNAPFNMIAFLVPADLPGVYVKGPQRTLGDRECPTADIEFTDVRVDDYYRLGGVGMGHIAQIQQCVQERILSSLRVNYVTRQCLDSIVSFLRARKINGEPLIHLNVLQHRLASLEAEWAMSRALAYRAMSELLVNGSCDMLSSSSKLLSLRLLRKVSKEALQLGGVTHYRSDSPIARHYTDAMLCSFSTESDEMLLKSITEMVKY